MEMKFLLVNTKVHFLVATFLPHKEFMDRTEETARVVQRVAKRAG